MSALDELFSAVLDAMAVLQDETEHERHGMATANRVSEHERVWYLDMLNAAIALMVERGLFPDDAEAEDAITPLAEAIGRERKAAWTERVS